MGLCLMCFRAIRVSKLRRYRWKTSETNRNVHTSWRIIWPRLRFNINDICCTICMYCSSTRTLSLMDVFPSNRPDNLLKIILQSTQPFFTVLLCNDVILLRPLANVRFWYTSLWKSWRNRSTVYDNGYTYDISNFWFRHMANRSKYH